jgi:precorrin-2 dehydrogenase/sirohydrochlorin ferrochelatase
VALYPLSLELGGRPCVVVGGGTVAEGKVKGLLTADAVVTVVSPSLTGTLAEAVRAGRIAHRRRVYQDGDLAGFALAFVATGDVAINAAVAAEGRRRGVWVNAADDPAHCDVILPSVLRRGTLTVAVSTGGASPALARAVREEIERHLGEDYAVLADVASAVRRTLRAERRPADAAAWRDALADARFRRLVARGDRAGARRRLRARLSA